MGCLECPRPVQARGLCNSHYRQWHRDRNRRAIVCDLCGKDAAAGYPGQRFCSNRCAARFAKTVHLGNLAVRRVRARLPVLYTGPPVPLRPPVHVESSRRLTSGQCRICDVWFVDFHANVTCSEACKLIHSSRLRGLGKARRRARKRDAYVEDVSPIGVFVRDKYRCHLCGKRVLKNVVVPHPRAATLDHVIPLAAGGTHEKSNCRTACFLCNSVKGDRGGGEQLMLVG